MRKNLTIALTLLVFLIISASLGWYYTHQEQSLGQAVLQSTPPSISPVSQNNTAQVLVGLYKSPTLGYVMSAIAGGVLYTNANDKNGKSSCYDACATMWPPFLYDGKDWTKAPGTLNQDIEVIQRTDGTMQYAYNSKPLYYYGGDTKSGDTNGNGVDGVWSVVKVDVPSELK